MSRKKLLVLVACVVVLFIMHPEVLKWEPAPTHKLISAADLVVVPEVGIGPIEFGMSREDVIRCIGKPEKEANRGMSLFYQSKGFTIGMSPNKGVALFNCYTRQSAPMYLSAADFSGKMKNGIGMGATQARIKEAFGQPDRQTDNGRQTDLVYKNPRMSFTLLDDKLIQFFLHAPLK